LTIQQNLRRISGLRLWRQDIQYNDTQHNDTKQNDTHHKGTQHNDTHHNDNQHNDPQTIGLRIKILIMLTYSIVGLIINTHSIMKSA
jgi:hypothetical protein